MSIAGAAGSAGSLLMVGAGIRMISNALPRKKILPRMSFKNIKPMKIKQLKMRRF